MLFIFAFYFLPQIYDSFVHLISISYKNPGFVFPFFVTNWISFLLILIILSTSPGNFHYSVLKFLNLSVISLIFSLSIFQMQAFNALALCQISIVSVTM